MKVSFFTIFNPNGTQSLTPKGPNMEFLKQHVRFQSIRKTETVLLPTVRFQDWLKKKTLENNPFNITFDPKWVKSCS